MNNQMRTFERLALACVLAAVPFSLAACGDDDDDDGDGDNNTAGTGGTGGTAGTGGNAGTAGGNAGTGGTGGDGGGNPSCDLSGAGKPRETIPNPTGNLTLTPDKVWVLSGTTYVADGQTLTIEPCTRIEGEKDPIGVLVVSRGADIVASGRADAPILFTSKQSVGAREPGDWGGIVVLGRAPNFQGTEVTIEGLTAEPRNQHGGSDEADSSGTLEHVIIEYPGYEVAPNVEVNGLTFGSVGSGTTVRNIFVNSSADDCFEWFGGNVNASNLVCQNSDDDMFDTDYGYRGTLTNLFGRHTIAPTEQSNGLEAGYDNASVIVPTRNTLLSVENVTVCGEGIARVTHGAHLRNFIEGNATSTLSNFVAAGFDYGINVDALEHPGISIKDSIVFGMVGNAASPIVNPSDDQAKDGNFDEASWFSGGSNNSTTAPSFTIADCKAEGGPAAAVKASNVGAFKGDATWLDWIPAGNWADQ